MDAVIGGEIERAPIVIAPGQVGAVARHAQAAEQVSAGVDHMNAARARAIDIALAVAFLAVGDPRLGAAQLVKGTTVSYTAVGVDVEGADQAEAGIVDVKDTYIRP